MTPRGGQPFNTFSTSARLGIEGAVPGRVTEMPATAQPKRTAANGAMPLASAAARPPLKASPAPVVSTTGATLKAGESVDYALGEHRHAYLVPALGSVEVNGVRIDARDGAAIRDEAAIHIKALADTEIVLVDSN